MTVENISAIVGLSEPTLRKYYFRELDKGVDLARGRVLVSMYEKAKGGNVTAQNAFIKHTERGLAAPPPSKRKPAEPKAEPLGKKLTAEAEAQTAHEGTEWGDLLH